MTELHQIGLEGVITSTTPATETDPAFEPDPELTDAENEGLRLGTHYMAADCSVRPKPSMMILGWILWDADAGEPFQRLAPKQWTGKRPKKPVTVYRFHKLAQNVAERHGCATKPVYLDGEP